MGGHSRFVAWLPVGSSGTARAGGGASLAAPDDPSITANEPAATAAARTSTLARYLSSLPPCKLCNRTGELLGSPGHQAFPHFGELEPEVAWI